MRKILAFTLAEVLITMTIVGVVATMTIPTLRFSKTKKEYSVKLKTFYNRMENAVLDMDMDKGSFKDMFLPNNDNCFTWYMNNIDPYLGHQYVNETSKAIYFKDGSQIASLTPNECLEITYDTNADKAPNTLGYDRFLFLFCFDNEHRVKWFNNRDIFFGTYGESLHTVGVQRTDMIDKCKNNPAYCSKLIQNDLWEFKSDYPIKF